MFFGFRISGFCLLGSCVGTGGWRGLVALGGRRSSLVFDVFLLLLGGTN